LCRHGARLAASIPASTNTATCISADHPLVAEFWEAFDYLDTLPVNTASGFIREGPNLNHSRDAALIAVSPGTPPTAWLPSALRCVTCTALSSWAILGIPAHRLV
jgi:hypothetical protein